MSDMEDVPQDRTLSVMYQLVSGTETRPTQFTLEFLGSWELGCMANSMKILTNPNGERTHLFNLPGMSKISTGRDLIFCIDADRKLCARNLEVFPDLPTSASPGPDSSSAHPNIPNSSKLKTMSSDSLPLHENKISMKVLLGDSQVLGQLSFDTPLCGLTLCPGKRDLFGAVWTETELIVRCISIFNSVTEAIIRLLNVQEAFGSCTEILCKRPWMSNG